MYETQDGRDAGGAPDVPPAAPPAFHLLAKPTGSVCNLDCAHCFFLEKERLYPGARSRMSDELLERYIRQLIEGHRTPEVTIAWQGGEPMLMGLEFFRRAVALARRYARPGMTVSHSIQTNGTKINGDWARFFKDNGFLVGVFEEWLRGDVGEVDVQLFDVALANWHGEPAGLCVHSPTCGAALALEFNGDVYACDHFVEPDYLRGNIREQRLFELVGSPEQRQFGRGKLDTLPQYCLDGDVRFACHGGCPKDRFIATPSGEPGLNYLCPGLKAFFHPIDAPMRRMCELLRAGQAPTEIVPERGAADDDAAALGGR